MNGLRIFLSFYLGFLVYSALIFFFDSSGFLSMKILAGDKIELEENIDDLKLLHNKLLSQFEALRSDPEVIEIHAREYGYFREDETVIRIDGYRPPARFYSVGKLINPRRRITDFTAYYRAAGFITALLFYLFSGPFFGRNRDNKAE